jgi:hypothetical protein
MLSLADCSVHDQFFRTNNMRNLSSARASAHFDYSNQTDSDVFGTLDSAVRPFLPHPLPVPRSLARAPAWAHTRGTRASRPPAQNVGLGEPHPGGRCRLG